jgi:hypothetical protein
MKERLLVEFTLTLEEVQEAVLIYARDKGEIPPGQPVWGIRMEYSPPENKRRALQGASIICEVLDQAPPPPEE